MSVYKEPVNVYKEEQVQLQSTFEVKKSAERQNLVFGWANVSKDVNGKHVFDWHNDICEPEDLELAAYEFTMKSRATGEMHTGDIKGVLVESIMFTKEKMQALGIPEGTVPEGWWVGFYIPDDEVFAKIISGEYNMFSIQGVAKKIQV